MRAVLFVLALSFGLHSCIPLPTEQGICRTSQGEIDTHNIIGVWKKDPKTAAEAKNFSEGNYRLLYIVRGTAKAVLEGDPVDGIDVYYNSDICEKVISNEVETRITKVGLYFHDDANKRIMTNTIDTTDKDADAVEETYTYSFSGNCNTTKLYLKKGSKTDSYSFFGTNPTTASCGGSQ